jgi:hypothetical protein
MSDSVKLVIFTSSYIHMLFLDIQELLSSRLYSECHIVTYFTEEVHLREAVSKPEILNLLNLNTVLAGDTRIFAQFERMAVSIMEKTSYRILGSVKDKPIVSIRHVPLPFCLFNNDVLLLPQCTDVSFQLASDAPSPTEGMNRISVSTILFQVDLISFLVI